MRFVLLVTFLICCLNIQSQTKTTPTASNDRAIVIPKRIERVRGRGEFASTDVALVPVITGLPVSVLKNIRKELKLERVMGEHSHELFKKKDVWNLNYDVTYNEDYILGLTFRWVFWSETAKTLAFDLTNGRLIKLSDLILPERMEKLAELVDNRLQGEIREMISHHKDSRNLEWAIKSQGTLKVTVGDLEDFSICETGLTLFFHAGFHHTASWAEPKGRYFFTYTELKPFLKPQTPVSQFIN